MAFALEVTGAPPSAIPGRVMRVLTQVGLASKARSYPRELSGGEQQRVAIARALVNDPPILLADEPTGNLDERATRSVFQLLRDINAGGTSVIMATHNLELVRQTTYRNLELKSGQLVYDSADEPAEGTRPVRLVTREALRARSAGRPPSRRWRSPRSGSRSSPPDSTRWWRSTSGARSRGWPSGSRSSRS